MHSPLATCARLGFFYRSRKSATCFSPPRRVLLQVRRWLSCLPTGLDERHLRQLLRSLWWRWEPLVTLDYLLLLLLMMMMMIVAAFVVVVVVVVVFVFVVVLLLLWRVCV